MYEQKMYTCQDRGKWLTIIFATPLVCRCLDFTKASCKIGTYFVLAGACCAAYLLCHTSRQHLKKLCTTAQTANLI